MDSIDDDVYEQNLLYLVYELQKLDIRQGTRLSDASALALMQKHPCHARIAGELASPTWANIDRLYLERHDYAKTKIVDRLVAEFGNSAIIKSEYNLLTGNMDIVLFPLRHGSDGREKRIGVEIKTGQTVDIFELERYLFIADYLLLVRIPSQQVGILDRNEMKVALANEISFLTDKVRRIAAGVRLKVEGPWCKGCPLTCEFKKRPYYYNNDKAPTLEFGQFRENLELTIPKLTAELSKLMKSL